MPEEFVETKKQETEIETNTDTKEVVAESLDEKRHTGSDMPWDNPSVPFGVRSFADLDAAEAAEEATDEVREDSEKMVKIVRNILNDSDDGDKAASIAKVASEFSERVANRSDQMKSGSGLFGAVIKTLKDAIDKNAIPEVDADIETDNIDADTDHNKQACKTEGGVCYPAKDYAFVPDSSKSSTWKLRLSQTRPGNITKAQLGRAAAAFSSGGFRGSKVKIPASDISRVKARIRREYRKLGVPTEDIPDSVKTKSKPTFMVWKDKETGRYIWLAKYSNNFRDDDSPPEIISAKSHMNFTDGVNLGKYDYPELRLWHRPEWVVGKSTWLAYDDVGDGTGFALAAGFFNPGMEEVAKSLAQAEDLGVSHGMPRQFLKRDPDDPTIITSHRTKEISVLPLYSAANRWTGFTVIEDIKNETDNDNENDKENTMSIPDDLKVQAQEAFGLDGNVIDQIEAANAKSAAKNQDLKIEFKAKDEETAADVAETIANMAAVDNAGEASDANVNANLESEISVDPDAPPTRKEVADAIITLHPLIAETVAKSVIEQLTPYMDAVKELATNEDKRLQEQADSVPRVSSLSDVLNQRVAALKSKDGISEKEAEELGGPKEPQETSEGSFLSALQDGKGNEHIQGIVQKATTKK